MVSRKSAYRALLLASASFVSFAASAQQTTSPAAQSGTADAIRVLLDQAQYWNGVYQYDKADQALKRVLTLDPNNPDGLALEAQSAADRGDQQAARTALAALRAARPDDPRIAMIQQTLQAGAIDQTTLTQARALAAASKPDDAVAAYHQIFRGNNPPPSLATEYFQTLAATDGNWEAGRAGLAGLLRLNPQNLRAQLAYAELLTYHDETRVEGIQRLQVLIKIASVSDQANKDLRQALLWMPTSSDNLALFEAYLADHPNDSDLQQRVQLAKSDSTIVRINGFDAMQAGQFDDADRDFTQALSLNAKDSDSMVGLALVRLHQRRADDAKNLLRQAIVLDPTKADTYQSLIDGTGPTNAGPTIDYGAIAARRIRSEYAQVAALTNRGRYAEAELRLRGLMGRRPTAANRLQLADIQARAGRFSDAEASYRSVLAAQPRNVTAMGGLAGVLTREGKLAEADALFARAESSGGGASIGRIRAQALQQQAEQVSDPVARTALFRAAVAADPTNPWLRLSLARGLVAQDRDAEANQVMAAVADSPKPSVEQIQAAIYFYNETHELQQASALIGRLPDKARTQDMRQIQARATLDADLREARDLGSLAATRSRLLAVAARPDPTGVRGAEISVELVRLGDKPAAREAIRLALAASRPVTPAQRLAYAGALLGAGYPNDAKTVTAALPVTHLSPLQASTLAALQDNTAVYSSDNLNTAGKTADAYDQLAPRLAANPDSPELNMALSRLYEAKQKPRQALAINEELLRRNPSSLAVRRSTVGAALAAGEYDRASELAKQTMTEFPDEPEAWVTAADVARARNEPGVALKDLKTARALRRQQLANQPDRSEATPRDRSAQADRGPRRLGVQYALNMPTDTATDAPSDAWATSDPQTAAAPELVTRQYAQYAPSDATPDLPIEGGPRDLPFPSTRQTAPQAMVAPVANNLSVPPSIFRAPGPLPALDQSAQIAAGSADPVFVGQSSQAGSPTVLAQATPLGLPSDNPFRSPAASAAPTFDEPHGLPDTGSVAVQQQQLTDPLTQDIDRSIAQVSADVAPRVDSSLSLRGRSGDDGLSKLLEVTAPVEASFSPNGYGRLTVQVTPTYLDSGKYSTSEAGSFGTNPLAGTRFGPAVAPAPRSQTAGGSGLDLQYAYGMVTADVGSTPLGFEQENVIGGIELHPKITDTFTLHLTVDRRAVDDSLLSYAGTRDVSSGQEFGGVTRNRIQAQIDGAIGPAYVYANVSGAYLFGDNVERNSDVSAGAGFSYPIYTSPTQEVRAGTNLVYFGYDKNLEGFTLGQGGYFSPQTYFAALFPINLRQQVSPDLVFNIGGSVGFQTFSESSSPIFPNSSILQNELVAAAATTPGLATTNQGGHFSGVAGGAHADVDYRLTPNFHIGASAGFDHSGDFTEGTGLVYARYVFNDPQ
jgi:cellulose synthase operon protein C